MSIYDKKFNVLLEQEADPAAQMGPATPPGPVEGEMSDSGTTLAAVSDVADNPVVNYQKEQNAAMTQAIGGWIGQIEDFTNFLNGLDGSSLQSQLNNAECDTLFNNVSKSETKKISRIAQDLRGLVESLKGYLLSSDEK